MKTLEYNPKRLGEKSELRFISKCVLNGWVVLIPWGDSARYDIVIDRGQGQGFERVQIKTARVSRNKGAIIFPACSSHYHTTKGQHTGLYRKSYHGEIEAFGVYRPETDECFLIPIEDVLGMGSQITLRLKPSSNGQVKRTRLAEVYRI